MNLRHIFSEKKNLVLIGILALAAFLRLYMIRDYLIFLGDEGRDALTAYNILHGHFTLLGPTASVGGFFFGPLYFYLMTPFLWLSHYDPVGPAIMVAIFGIVTVFLVYILAKQFFTQTTALIASFLYAINAYTILFSRSSWNPHLVPFFVILTALSIYKGVLRDNRWYVSLSGFFYGLVFELHYVTLFFAFAMLLFLLFTTRQQTATVIIKNFLMKFTFWVVGFIGGILPIVAFEIRHQFVNTRNIFEFIFFSKDTGSGAQFLPTIMDTFARVFTRGVFGFPQSQDFHYYSQIILFIWYWIPVMLGIGAVTIIWKEWQNALTLEEKYARLLLLLWFGSGVILFGFYKKNIYEYYFEMLFPVSTILVSRVFALFYNRGKLQKVLIAGILLLVLGVNATQYPFRYPPNEQIDQTKQIAQAVLGLAGNAPYNFALITGGNSDHAYRYFLTLAGHPPIILNTPITDPNRQSVTQQLIVVCESLPCSPLGYPLWEVAGFGRADIITKEHVSVVDIYKLKHYSP